MHAVGGAALHGVEGLEGRHQLAGGEYLDGQPPAGRLADGLGEALRRGAAAGNIFGQLVTMRHSWRPCEIAGAAIVVTAAVAAMPPTAALVNLRR